MDKLSDVGTVVGGAALVTAIGGIIYSNNKINEVREELTTMTSHLATTISEGGTLDKMNEKLEHLGMALRQLNSNIGEVAAILSEEQTLREEQMSVILEFMSEVGDVKDGTKAILSKSTGVRKVELPRPQQQHPRLSLQNPFNQPKPADRKTTLANLGLGI